MCLQQENREIEKDEENAFLIAIHLKYFGYTYWLWKTYRQYSQIVIQLGLQFEQGYVRIGVVEAVDMNPLNLDGVASIPDPVKYHPGTFSSKALSYQFAVLKGLYPG